jgi:CMP-N-acetylneuraminic acid synthetase
MKNKRIAIVPARIGSKSILEKNLTPILGKPLINYVVETIIKSNRFDSIVINSDSEKFAKIAEHFGIEFYRRKEYLSRDETDINDVLLDMFDCKRLNFEWIYLFQPTSPFVKVDTINGMISLESEDCDLLQSISKVSHNSHCWNQRVVNGKRVSFAFANERQKAFQKQQKPQHYIFGNLLALRRSSYAEYRRIWMPASGFIEVNRFESFDLDGPDDVAYAEFLLRDGIVSLD